MGAVNKYSPILLFGGAASDQTLPYDLQDCVNYIPEVAETPQARSRGILRGAPGLTLLTTCGNGPIRGLHSVEGQLFAVSGTGLYSISNAGAATLLSGATVIGGVGRVSMAHNQISGGNQLVLAAGASGFVWNTVTGTFTPISNAGWRGSKCANFIDSYITHVAPSGDYFYNSALADALTYPTTNEYEAEAQPDPIVSQVNLHDELWTFGARTIQIFVNTGQTDAIFAPQQGTVIEQGCAGTYTPAVLDNSVFWLGNDGIVYRNQGYLPVRVSTYSIEQEIAKCNWGQAFGFAWVDRGHKVYYLTFPDGKTWGYDIATNLWHRRASWGIDNWRVNNLVQWQQSWVGSDSYNGNLYTIDWNNFTENGQALVAMRRTPFISDHQNRITMAELELYMDTGYQTMNGDENVWLRYSDDAGKTWSPGKSRLLYYTWQQRGRVRFMRLGRFRDRVLEISVSSPVKRDLIAANVRIME